jgi:hypothetical protein
MGMTTDSVLLIFLKLLQIHVFPYVGNNVKLALLRIRKMQAVLL